MSHYRTMKLVAICAALALAGCGAATPERVERTVPGPVAAPDAPIVVEVEGIAYLGDEDQLKDVRKRAWDEAVRLAFEKGASLHVEARSRSEFATLVEDSVSQASSGTLTRRKVIEEGLEGGNRYRIVMRATFRPGDPKTARPGGEISTGEDGTLDRVAGEDITGKSRRDVRNEPGKQIEADARPLQESEQDIAPARTVSDGAPDLASGASERPSESSAAEGAPESESSTKAPVVPQESVTVCCHEFPEVLGRRVHSVLDRIEGITRLQRVATNNGSLCYRFHYDDRLEVLEDRLDRELRTSSSLSFKIEHGRGPGMIDLVFDGGFD